MKHKCINNKTDLACTKCPQGWMHQLESCVVCKKERYMCHECYIDIKAYNSKNYNCLCKECDRDEKINKILK